MKKLLCTTMGVIELTSDADIVEVEKLYEALPEEEQSKVENYETLFLKR